VVVIVNLSNTERGQYRIGFPAPGEWKLLLNSDSKTYSDAFGDHPSTDLTAVEDDYDGLQASAEISIAPYSLLIYGWRG
jgi:1,4-alpha-glucan branching enzyme